MIVTDDCCCCSSLFSCKGSAEEEFYYRLQENPVYPFECIAPDLYYLRIRSDGIILGGAIIGICSLIFFLYSSLVGLYAIPVSMTLAANLIGCWMLFGNFCVKELIISSEGGYIVRIAPTEKITVEQGSHNVYIRLQENLDTLGTKWYFLILGGYILDDIRLSRLSQHQVAMRAMGRRLALNMGLNYFDASDTTSKHVVLTYPDFSSHMDALDDEQEGVDEDEVAKNIFEFMHPREPKFRYVTEVSDSPESEDYDVDENFDYYKGFLSRTDMRADQVAIDDMIAAKLNKKKVTVKSSRTKIQKSNSSVNTKRKSGP